MARTRLARLQYQLDGISQGVYVGDGRNDVPYSRQRMDEVTIQLAEIDVRLKENEAGRVILELGGVDPFAVEFAAFDHQRDGKVLAKISYALEGAARDQMIVKLYTGSYSQDITAIDKSAVASGI